MVEKKFNLFILNLKGEDKSMHTPLSSVATLIGWGRKSKIILLALVLTLSIAGSAGATTYNVSINVADIVAGIEASGNSLHGNYGEFLDAKR